MFKTQSSKLIEIEHLSAGYDGKQVLSEGTLDKEALKTTGRAIRVG